MNCSKILRLMTLSAVIAVVSTAPAWSQTSKMSAHTEQRIHRIEANVAAIPVGQGQPPLQFDLQTLMQTLHIPGLSVAVIDNFQIVWAKGYGVTESGSHTPVTCLLYTSPSPRDS